MSLDQVAHALRSAGARDEALGEYVQPRRVLGVSRPPRIVPVGRAWRLGDILLMADGSTLLVGSVVRAVTPKDFNSDKTAAGEARRELQRAAIRGGIAEGDVVNVDWQPVDAVDPAALRERAALLIEQTQLR